MVQENTGKDIGKYVVITLNFLSMGHPKSGALWDQPIIEILTVMEFKGATNETFIYRIT